MLEMVGVRSIPTPNHTPSVYELLSSSQIVVAIPCRIGEYRKRQ